MATAFVDLPLEELNAGHIADHGAIRPRARELVDRLTAEIEARTALGRPAPGDVVIAIGWSNHRGEPVRYEHGHLQSGHLLGYYAGEMMSGCTRPYAEPHVSEDGYIESSGGYWFAVNPEDLKHVGTRKKLFWCWGVSFPQANGGIRFLALVNVWEYTNNEQIY